MFVVVMVVVVIGGGDEGLSMLRVEKVGMFTVHLSHVLTLHFNQLQTTTNNKLIYTIEHPKTLVFSGSSRL